MTLLANLAAFFILGVFQVSSNEYKDIHIANKHHEVKCFEDIHKLTRGNAAITSFIKQDIRFKEETLQSLLELITAVNHCCGKESEEKKCLEERVLHIARKVVQQLSDFREDYLNLLLQVSTNISLLATYAQNEIDCCCKLESCEKKYELPTASYKGKIKECKADNCAHALNHLMTKLPGFVDTVATAGAIEKEFLQAYENIQKLKEDIPKDGKCKEEKKISSLRSAIDNLNFLAKAFLKKQAIASTESQGILAYAAATVREILECPIEKDSKQHS